MSIVRRTLRRLHRKWDEALSDADHHFALFGRLADGVRQVGLWPLDGRRVLDIGCGDRAAQTLLFAAAGGEVHGIDVLPVRLGWQRPLMWVQTAASGRFVETGRLVVRDAIHTWRYWRQLRRRVGLRLPADRAHLHRMSAERLTFPDEWFDVVVSSAVWEHLPDVPAAVRELNRVLKPGGLALIEIALWPSLQGGHHADWHDLAKDPRRAVPPWDHLRGGRHPLPIYCNGWREAQYREVFEREMVVERWEEGRITGGEYLIPAIRAELGDYTERDLLLLSVTAWARKRRASAANVPIAQPAGRGHR